MIAGVTPNSNTSETGGPDKNTFTINVGDFHTTVQLPDEAHPVPNTPNGSAQLNNQMHSISKDSAFKVACQRDPIKVLAALKPLTDKLMALNEPQSGGNNMEGDDIGGGVAGLFDFVFPVILDGLNNQNYVGLATKFQAILTDYKGLQKSTDQPRDEAKIQGDLDAFISTNCPSTLH